MGAAGQRERADRWSDDRRSGLRAPDTSDVLLWVAVIVDTLLAVIDALTPVVLFGPLVFGPLVAAFRTRPRTTALVAVYAVALALYEGVPHDFFGSVDHLVRVTAIAATGVLAVWGSIKREQSARGQVRALEHRAARPQRRAPAPRPRRPLPHGRLRAPARGRARRARPAVKRRPSAARARHGAGRRALRRAAGDRARRGAPAAARRPRDRAAPRRQARVRHRRRDRGAYRRPLLGVGRLERLLAGCGDLDAVATGERIEAAILGDAEPRDDIAVLVLRATGPGLEARGREGLVRAGSLGRERALKLRLPGGAHAPAVARAAVDGLPAGSIEAPVAHTARLLASEIVTNSVTHGGSGEDDWIGFDVALSPGGLRVEVTDHGPGFAATSERPDPDDPGGRGLFLVDALADRWGSADGGTRVWFEVDRPSRGKAA